MASDRTTLVESLFGAALDLPPDRREAFVRDAAPDAGIAADVLGLLAAHDGAGTLDRITDQLRGLRPALAAIPPPDFLPRLRNALHERYRIEREVARSRMAVVLLAHDLRHGRSVALKVLQPRLAASVGADRFLREIAIAAQLAHPHILPLHESGEADGLLYYVMPYLDGESLRDRLRSGVPIPPDEAVRIIRQVGDALCYAHDRGVIHCDIKPENILLHAGHALVTDFGIARAVSAATAAVGSEEAVVVGTPGYASPEQLAGAADLDARTDVYSLARVLEELLGAASHADAGAGADAGATTAGAPYDRGARRVTDPAYDPVIRRATAALAGDRFESVQEFLAAVVSATADAATRPPARSRVMRRRAAVVAAVVVLVLAAAASVAVWPRGVAHPAAAVVAVLPAVTATGDSALDRLSRELVVTLSANFDDVGGIRAIDALSVLAQTRAGPRSLGRSLELGRRLGASSVVHGTIIGAGDSVRVDVGLFATRDGGPLARAVVTAMRQDLSAITDSLTWRLLEGVWRTDAPPTPSLASITTRSVPALRAFLDGERASLESRWRAATDAYHAAIRADRSFWLAYWRYAWAHWWYLEAVDDSIIRTIEEHRDELPRRDRLVFDAWVTDSFAIGIDRARRAVEQYPDYWPAWMQYADWLFHVGPVYGYDRADAQHALERTVSLHPSFAPGWDHLFALTVDRDAATAARSLEALQRLGFGAASAEEFGYDVSRVYRLDLQWLRTGSLDDAVLDTVVEELVHRAHHRLGGGANLLPVQTELSRRVVERTTSPELAAVHRRVLADVLAGRGAWDEAITRMEEYASHEIGTGTLAAYRLAVLAAWLGALPPERARLLRARADNAARRPGSGELTATELAWLDGLLAAAVGDTAGIRQARTAVRSADSHTSRVLDLCLAGLEAGLRGASARAADILADLDWDAPDLLVPGYDAHPYVIAVARLAAGRTLTALGDTARAERALQWFEATWALDGYRPARRVLAGLALADRARIAALRGDTAAVRLRYTDFLRRYDSAPPAHRPLVDSARAALRRVDSRAPS